MYIVDETKPFVEAAFRPIIVTMKPHFMFLLLLAALLINPLVAAGQQAGTAAPGNTKGLGEFPDQYPTLFEAVKAADLLTVLQNGPFTVFAPSDAAFQKLDGAQMMDLLKPENKKKLKSLVAYHIVAGELTASRILKALCRGEGATRFTTVQGEELLATLEGSDIILMDCRGNRARIVAADSVNTNVVLHEIDSVVLPRPL